MIALAILGGIFVADIAPALVYRQADGSSPLKRPAIRLPWRARHGPRWRARAPSTPSATSAPVAALGSPAPHAWRGPPLPRRADKRGSCRAAARRLPPRPLAPLGRQRAGVVGAAS